jgi:hypothetical protein
MTVAPQNKHIGDTGRAPSMKLDHVIIATTDLAHSVDQLARTSGLVAVEGGPHDGLGTYNYIVPLGRGYLELVAIVDRDMAQRNDFGLLVNAALDGRAEAFAGWAVEVAESDLRVHAERLTLPIGRLTRRGLGVDHVGMSQTRQCPGLPFLLSRNGDDAHPQSVLADHDVKPNSVHTVTVAESRVELEDWLGPRYYASAALYVACRGTGRGITGVTIDTDGGRIALTNIEPTRAVKA